jgi:hypothetical protein
MIAATTVYSKFLSQVKEYDWVTEADISVAKSSWIKLLNTAIFNFIRPDIDLTMTYNEEEEEWYFDEDITQNEIEVLASGMRSTWVAQLLADIDNLRLDYNEQDWNQSSKANYLKALKTTVDYLDAKFEKDLNTYHRKAFDFGTLVGKDQ